MAYRIVNEVDSDPALTQTDNMSVKSKGGTGSVAMAAEGRSTGIVVEVNGSAKKMDEDEERDAVFFRLEMLGYRVGQGLVERYVLLPRFCGSGGGMLNAEILWMRRGAV